MQESQKHNKKIAILLINNEDDSLQLNPYEVYPFDKIFVVKIGRELVIHTIGRAPQICMDKMWRTVLGCVFSETPINDLENMTIMDNTNYGPFFNSDIIHNAYNYSEFDVCCLTESNGKLDTNYIIFNKKFITSDFFKNWSGKNKIELDEQNHPLFKQIDNIAQMRQSNKKITILFPCTYISNKKEEKYYSVEGNIDHFVCDKNYPFIPKELFKKNYAQLTYQRTGKRLDKTLSYLTYKNANVIQMIKDAIKHTTYSNLYYNLNLNYLIIEQEKQPFTKCAIIMHIFYKENFNKFEKKIKELKNIDLYITTSVNNEEYFKEKISKLNLRATIVTVPNIGRDLYSLLIYSKEIYNKYDFICFVHDKKSTHLRNSAEAVDFQELIVENTIPSENYISSILSIFESNPHIGLLCPPFPKSGDYFILMGNNWTCNYNNSYNLLKRIGSNQTPSKEDCIFSLGTSFWYRTDAFKKIYEIDWSKMLHPEPTTTDGDINHTIERIIPYLVQDAGYLTGVTYSMDEIRSELVNNIYMSNTIIKLIRDTNSINASTLLSFLKQYKSSQKPLNRIKSILTNFIKK